MKTMCRWHAVVRCGGGGSGGSVGGGGRPTHSTPGTGLLHLI